MQYLTLVKTTKEGRTDALGIMFISGSLEVLNNTIKSWELLDAREEADRLGLPVPDYQDEDGDDDTKRDLDELARGLYDIIKSHHDIILDKTYEQVRDELQDTYDRYLEYRWETYGQLIMRERTHRIKGGTLK